MRGKFLFGIGLLAFAGAGAGSAVAADLSREGGAAASRGGAGRRA